MPIYISINKYFNSAKNKKTKYFNSNKSFYFLSFFFYNTIIVSEEFKHLISPLKMPKITNQLNYKSLLTKLYFKVNLE